MLCVDGFFCMFALNRASAAPRPDHLKIFFFFLVMFNGLFCVCVASLLTRNSARGACTSINHFNLMCSAVVEHFLLFSIVYIKREQQQKNYDRCFVAVVATYFTSPPAPTVFVSLSKPILWRVSIR